MTHTDELQALPDILMPGLSVIFCGINPGLRAASTGHHFAGRGNRFWRTLHLAGFTPEEIRPEDDRSLLQYTCGLTTAAPRATASATQLARSEIRTAAAGFERKIARYAPRYVAFLGKMAVSELMETREIEWGLQSRTFGGATVWVLPNPSGLNRAFSQDALAAAYRELRVAVHSVQTAR
jgi:double-stranded uracil-DNA glycosylase